LGLVLNGVGDLAFYKPLGAPGIPLSTSLVSVVTFAILLKTLSRRIGGLPRDMLVRGFTQCLFGAAVLAVMAWATFRVVSQVVGVSLVGQIISVGTAAVVGGAAFLAAAQAVALPELSQLTRLVRALR
jgi:peptidoglycan biosynthesis protein MviN/MurJ (putative lipid II flippase)